MRGVAVAANLKPRRGICDSAAVMYAACVLAAAERRADGWVRAAVYSDEPAEGQVPAQNVAAWRQRVREAAQTVGDMWILAAENGAYPRLLLETPAAPQMVFGRGALHGADTRSAAIVGSRRASPQTLDAARGVAALLAEAGVSVVSGLARGVDTAAHHGALDAGGHTTAVLGTGIAVCYPPENLQLAESIAATGAVVSQFPPRMAPSKTSFPSRNAVVAGLSLCSVAMDAAERSGTRIEIDLSLRFGRPVLLWGPAMGQLAWAQRLASGHHLVEMVGSGQEIAEIIAGLDPATANPPTAGRERSAALPGLDT